MVYNNFSCLLGMLNFLNIMMPSLTIYSLIIVHHLNIVLDEILLHH